MQYYGKIISILLIVHELEAHEEEEKEETQKMLWKFSIHCRISIWKNG